MLQKALKIVFPGVKLRRESAFAWRGYQIINYPGLKDSQYYCQIYLGRPHILTFFEYFEMSHYPFKVEFDLLTHGFFALSYEAQQQMLIGFIKEASSNAINWNDSQKRKEIVPTRLQ